MIDKLTDDQKFELSFMMENKEMMAAGSRLQGYLGYTVDIQTRMRILLAIYRECSGTAKFNFEKLL